MARSKQPRRASLDDLLSKQRRTKELSLGDEGSEVTLLFQALGAKEYDDLIAEHPPTADQKKQGAAWNGDVFAPALISACSVEPKIDVDAATSIWTSEAWSRGELMDLFMAVVGLNSEGMRIPFTEND